MKRAEYTNNTARTPLRTPVEAAEDEKTTGAPEARKTMDTTEVTKNVPKSKEDDDTIKNTRCPWHCIICKTSRNSPKQLATHMIGNHWEDSWTLRMENTPLEFRIAMKGANNQVQAKNMVTIAKDTMRTMEVGAKDATEAMAK